MLPFIVGGVALATAGYGLKKYCESNGAGCDEFNDGLVWISDRMEDLEDMLGMNEYHFNVSSQSSSASDPLATLYKVKKQMYQESIVPFCDMLRNIENFDANATVCREPKLKEESTETLTEKIQNDLTGYVHLLKSAHQKLSLLFEELQGSLPENADYAQFDDKSKHCLKQACVYAGVLVSLMEVKVVKKSGKPNQKLSEAMLLATKRMLEAETMDKTRG